MSSPPFSRIPATSHDQGFKHPAVELQKFTPADFSRLIGWVDSPRTLEIWGAWRFHFPLTKAQLYDYLHRVGGRQPVYLFRVAAIELRQIVGHLELNFIDHAHGVGTMCRLMVAPEYRNQGYGRAILQACLKYGFEVLKLQRLDLQVYHVNEAGINCYEQAGFVREGRLRRIRQVEGEYWDLIWYSLLREEWEEFSTGNSGAEG